jgi:hypothetical protein
LDAIPVFFLHTLIVQISQGRTDQRMGIHLQNESPYKEFSEGESYWLWSNTKEEKQMLHAERQ